MNLHVYRPQRTRPELLEQISVGREHLLREVLERLDRWAPAASRQHYLFIGPRGIGKTHLLHLIDRRVRSDPKLRDRWMPILLAEESYSISKVSDLLLEMLRRLGEEPGMEAAAKVYEEARFDDGDKRVCDRCLDAFRCICRETSRGILLMMENLDRLLERQVRPRSEVHRLRKILIEEDWLVTLCTSPTFLNAVSQPEEPFFEFFDVRPLAELTPDEQVEMLRKLAAAEGSPEIIADVEKYQSRLRALYHFTGGSPRLSVMLYDLVAHRQLGAVRNELDLLLDQLTPLYQDRMKEVSEQEAKVLETMALLPEGYTPTELAQESRMDAKVVRATLTRLERAGYVRREERRKKRTIYIVPERLFRIWHQANHSRAARGRVQYLLEFFSSWYATSEERDEIWEELASAFERGGEGATEDLNDIAEYMDYVAATILARKGTAASFAPLVRALDDPDSYVRGSAARALGKLGDRSAVDALVRTLDDPKNNVRGSAAVALGRILEVVSGPELEQVLHVLLESTTSSTVRRRLYEVFPTLLRAAFLSGDLDLTLKVIQIVSNELGSRGLSTPYDALEEYLSSNRDPAVLERQQPEIREAVRLLVDLSDEGGQES